MVRGDGYIFVHVPKTGGTSVTAALGGRSGDTLHTPLSAVDSAGLKTFGFVRNPWDWMFSVHAYTARDGAGFKDWLLGGSFYLDDDIRTPELAPMQRRSQMYWLDGCEKVGRFEHLAADLSAIVKAWGISCKRLGHLNRTDHGDYRDHYDEETVAVVATHCAPEIERFGYQFS